MKKISKAQLRRAKALAKMAGPDEPNYPPPPHITNGTLTASGAELIRLSAGAGNRGIYRRSTWPTPKAFKKLLKDDDGAFARAWQAADAEYESKLFAAISYRAFELHDPESIKFLLRVRGHREFGAAIEINNEGPRIGIMLPGSQSAEAYYQSLGISAPLDTRDSKTLIEHGSGWVSPTPKLPLNCARPVARPMPLRSNRTSRRGQRKCAT